MTENDINRAFNSEYVRSQLQTQKIHVNGQLMTIIPKQVNSHLPGNSKVALSASILLRETNETQQVAFSAVPKVSANGQTVSLENVDFGDAQKISPDLTKALINRTSEILNLSNFNLEGMTLRVKELEVETGKLIMQAEAYAEQIPSA